MKNYIKVLILSLLAVFFFGCNKSNSEAPAGKENFGKDASYAFGMNVGTNMKNSMEAEGIVMDTNEFMKGMKDSVSGGKTRFTLEESYEIIEAAFTSSMEKKNAPYQEKEIEFLAENSRKPGITITSSGLQYEVVTQTNGAKPSFTDTVLVHYTGKLVDGTVFDSSVDSGEPASFPLYEVIPGWSEGLQLMSVGSKYILYIPSEKGYGPNGIQGIIPPYSTLVFEVELLDILN